MPRIWFGKELVSKPVYDRHGKQIPFEVFGGDYGGISVDTETDKDLVEDLNKMAGSLGVFRTSERENDAKKALPKHSPQNPRGEIRVFNPQKPTPPSAQNPAAAEANFQPSIPPHRLNPLAPIPRTNAPPPAMTQEPPKVPMEGFKPRTGRAGPRKSAAPLP